MSKDTRTKNVTRNIFFGLSYKVVTLVLPFVTRTLLLYLMGVASVGVSTLFTSILSFLSLAELGFGAAVVYSMYKPIADNDIGAIDALLSYYRRLYRIIGGIILAIGLAITPFLPLLTKGEAPEGINLYALYFIYLANTVLSYFAAGYRQSLLVAYQRADVKDKIAMIVTLLVRVLEIAVIYYTKNLYLYALSAVVGTITTNILTAVVTRRMYPEIRCRGNISDEQKHAIAKKIAGLLGTKLNSIIVHQADVIVISAFLGLTVVAEYGNYYYILNTVSGFIMILFSSMTASIGNKIATDTTENVHKLFDNISFINEWIVGWSCVCLLCLYQPFVERWVGKDLMLDMSSVILLVVYLYVFQVGRTILTFKDASGLWYEDRFRPYISMVVNVVSNLVLVQVIGLNGVVISSIIAFLISVPWCNYIVFKHIFDESSVKNMLRLLKTALITAAVAYATYYVCSFCHGGKIGLLERFGICMVMPNALFFAIFGRSETFKMSVKMLKNMIGRRGKAKSSQT